MDSHSNFYHQCDCPANLSTLIAIYSFLFLLQIQKGCHNYCPKGLQGLIKKTYYLNYTQFFSFEIKKIHYFLNLVYEKVRNLALMNQKYSFFDMIMLNLQKALPKFLIFVFQLYQYLMFWTQFVLLPFRQIFEHYH